MQKYLLPKLASSQIPAVLVGDLNFDASIPAEKTASGLDNFVNVFEGQVTCSDQNLLLLKGLQQSPNLEKIDAMILNSLQIIVSQVNIEPVSELTDHFALSATVHRNKLS